MKKDDMGDRKNDFMSMAGASGVPLFLAPMAGVTDQAFRVLCREKGADVLVTEMVSAKAITYRNVRRRRRGP